VDRRDVGRFPLGRKATANERVVEDGTKTWCNLLTTFLQEPRGYPVWAMGLSRLGTLAPVNYIYIIWMKLNR
jgi:hypothetical protein